MLFASSVVLSGDVTAVVTATGDTTLVGSLEDHSTRPLLQEKNMVHTVDVTALSTLLETDVDQGLSQGEAERRLVQNGENVLSDSTKRCGPGGSDRKKGGKCTIV
jgi:magnesium-transporting ATPase (P-type)